MQNIHTPNYISTSSSCAFINFLTQRMKRIHFLASILRAPPRPAQTSFGRLYSTASPRLQQSRPPANMATISGDDGPTAPAPPLVNDPNSTPATKEEKPLPKLTASEFRQYNRMAEHMNYFHDNFRATWKVLYGACEAQKRPKNMSIRQFISVGQQFCRKPAHNSARFTTSLTIST
jgi:hypothetical protein